MLPSQTNPIDSPHDIHPNSETHVNSLQVLKLSRYSSGGTLVWRTLQNSGPALGLITTFTIVLSFLVGSLIFYFEQGTFKVRVARYYLEGRSHETRPLLVAHSPIRTRIHVPGRHSHLMSPPTCDGRSRRSTRRGRSTAQG